MGIVLLLQHLDEISHRTNTLHLHNMPETIIEAYGGQLAMAHNETLSNRPEEKEMFGAITN